MAKTKSYQALLKQELKDPKFKKAYDAFEDEFNRSFLRKIGAALGAVPIVYFKRTQTNAVPFE